MLRFGECGNDVPVRQERLPSRDAPAICSLFKRPLTLPFRKSKQQNDNVPEDNEGSTDAQPGYGRLRIDASTREVWLSDSDEEDKHREKMPRDEGYAVTKGRMKDIIMRLQVRLPTVDAFASREIRVCSRWWRSESEHPYPLRAD